MIIGVSGKICSGKDTVYKIIQYLTSTSVRWTIPFEKMNADHTMDNTAWNRISNWENKKFADKLKQCVSIITGIPKVNLEKEEVKTKLLGEEWTRYGYADSFYRDMNGTPIMNNKQCSKEEYIRQYKINEQTAYKHEYTVREILQLFGTEVGRQIHYNFWINALFSEYKGDIEIWKDIIEYEGQYKVSSFGRVKSLPRKVVYGNEELGKYHTYKNETILQQTPSGKHYLTVHLNGTNYNVHTLVATAFCDKSLGSEVVAHKDQNPKNNFYKNLEWTTQSKNIIDANLNGNGNIGTKQKNAKLTENDVLIIKQLLKEGKPQNLIAKEFNISITTICDINKGRKWSHVGKVTEIISPIVPILPPNWVITDVRFPNELKAIKDRCGITIRLKRTISDSNNMPFKNHLSETALDDATFDYTIDNNGTIEELVEKVKEILIKEKII